MADTVDVRTSLALGHEAVVTTELGDLLSDSGVPLSLEKGEQQVVVVRPTPCCSHSGCKAVSAATQPTNGQQPTDEPTFAPAFDTAEHAIIVAGLSLQTEAGPLDAARAALPIAQIQVPNCTTAANATYALTYGQLIALGGDFYGDPDHPVCTSPNPLCQFAKNFNSMGAARSEVQAILGIANSYEFGPIAWAVRAGRQPSGVYAALPTTPPHVVPDEDRAFDEATGGTSVKNGRYLNLANTNFDHFGIDAIACYTAGHRLAQQQAAAAKSIGDPTLRAKALLVAYAINAFADHFLTDLFAAGHMRTPRRPLFNSAMNGATQIGASLCAKQMHDEDNKFGVWVSNEVGDTWVAYGDARYRDKWNAADRVIVKRAVQASMDGVYKAFTAGAVVDPNAGGVIPFTAKVIREITQPATGRKHRDDTRNWAPLFWWDPSTNNVNRRNSLFDPSDRSYCEQGTIDPRTWGITTTIAQIKAAGSPVYMPRSQYHTFPPDETGATGQYGWPPVPGGMTGPLGATGPTLRGGNWSWIVDGAPGPTQIPSLV